MLEAKCHEYCLHCGVANLDSHNPETVMDFMNEDKVRLCDRCAQMQRQLNRAWSETNKQ